MCTSLRAAVSLILLARRALHAHNACHSGRQFVTSVWTFWSNGQPNSSIARSPFRMLIQEVPGQDMGSFPSKALSSCVRH